MPMTDTDLTRLYSGRILALAADIPHLGRLANPAGTARKRSPLCGSTVTVDLKMDGDTVTDFAHDVKACALGPDFIEINRMYRQRAFELVLVAANYPDERKEVLAFLKRNQCSTTNYLFNTKTGDNAPSGKYKLIEAFDKEWNGALPYTVLISPAGEILYKESGPIDPLELKRTIVKALKEDRFK